MWLFEVWIRGGRRTGCSAASHQALINIHLVTTSEEILTARATLGIRRNRNAIMLFSAARADKLIPSDKSANSDNY